MKLQIDFSFHWIFLRWFFVAVVFILLFFFFKKRPVRKFFYCNRIKQGVSDGDPLEVLVAMTSFGFARDHQRDPAKNKVAWLAVSYFRRRIRVLPS